MTVGEVFCFSPHEADWGRRVSFYDRSKETPLDVPDADRKMDRAIDALPKPMAEHELTDVERARGSWVRYDYETLVHGDDPAAARIDPEPPEWHDG